MLTGRKSARGFQWTAAPILARAHFVVLKVIIIKTAYRIAGVGAELSSNLTFTIQYLRRLMPAKLSCMQSPLTTSTWLRTLT